MTHVLTTDETSKPSDLGTRVVIAACLVALATCASACSNSPPTKTATSSAQTSKPEPSTSPASPSTQSSRVGGDASDITSVYQRFFNVKTPVAISTGLLQDGPAFASYLAAQAKSPASHGLRVTVSNVVVNSPNKATVTFSVLLNGSPVLANQTGYAVRQGGQWKVAGDTYCGLLAAQGAPPPMCSTPAATALPGQLGLDHGRLRYDRQIQPGQGQRGAAQASANRSDTGPMRPLRHSSSPACPAPYLRAPRRRLVGHCAVWSGRI